MRKKQTLCRKKLINMNFRKFYLLTVTVSFFFVWQSCTTPRLAALPGDAGIPGEYSNSVEDTTNSGEISWRNFFSDTCLVSLIDTALKNNKELKIALQEIEIARSDVRSSKAFLLPRVDAGAGIGVEKVGRYTSQGAGDASTDIIPGKEVPDVLPDYNAGFTASWEIDIWHKLHNANKAAINRFLSSVQGRNFVSTNLINEIANDYYELLALDNQLDIVRKTIVLQKKALEIVKVQKQAAAANELAVKKFQGEVLNSASLEFDIMQQIKEKEYDLNFLLGRYPQPVIRDTSGILLARLPSVAEGVPTQLLTNRPDIRQAEFELAAAKLDVKVARAEFYPSSNISGSLGMQAFSPSYLLRFPRSLLLGAAGDLAGPVINKNAIKAEYFKADARQRQAVYNYQRSILNAVTEVSTEISNLENYSKMYDLKSKEVDTLAATIDISNELFRAARADYLEVLLAQRDALSSRLELIDTRLHQFTTVANLYKSLGGGWK